ncbi:MAG: hypothetical protein ACM3ZE_24540 [Myxococcales bacterium]
MSILGVLACWVTAYQVQRRRSPARSLPPAAAPNHRVLLEAVRGNSPRLHPAARVADRWLASAAAAFDPVDWETQPRVHLADL